MPGSGCWSLWSQSISRKNPQPMITVPLRQLQNADPFSGDTEANTVRTCSVAMSRILRIIIDVDEMVFIIY